MEKWPVRARLSECWSERADAETAASAGHVKRGACATGGEASAPNEVWTVDFKGWWRNGDKRCEPLTVRDEYSRYVLELRAVEDARSETVRQSFERLFERHGLPQAIRSDNGSPFASVHGLFGLESALGLVGGAGDRFGTRSAWSSPGQWSP